MAQLIKLKNNLNCGLSRQKTIYFEFKFTELIITEFITPHS